MKIIASLILIVFLQNGYSQNLELWLPSTEYIVGEKINCSLNITDIDTLDVFDKNKFKYSTENKFRYSFQITPEKTGLHDLGPFTLTYGGQELKSNIVTINVVEPNSEMKKIKILIPEKIRRNTEITISFISSLSSLNQIKLKESESLEVISNSFSSNFSFKDNKSVSTYVKKFVVKFKNKGKSVIDGTWLEKIPKKSIVIPIEIKVS